MARGQPCIDAGQRLQERERRLPAARTAQHKTMSSRIENRLPFWANGQRHVPPVGAAFRAKGTKSALEQHSRCQRYAEKCRGGVIPSVKIAKAAELLIRRARERTLTGDPRADWTTIKQDVRAADDDAFKQVASALDYLVAFGHGRRICEKLSAMWMAHKSYPTAREGLHAALTQEQILSAGEQLHGIHVMNMHKCKGKQFDGVVLYRQQYHSPFVWRSESPPHTRSRRLLQVAITRAQSHVLVLDEAMSKCPILDPHRLWRFGS